MWALIALPGLALAGLPFTSGAVSKLVMKQVLDPETLELELAELLAPLMSAGAIATLLLVLRYLWVLHKQTRTATNHPALLAGWLANHTDQPAGLLADAMEPGQPDQNPGVSPLALRALEAGLAHADRTGAGLDRIPIRTRNPISTRWGWHRTDRTTGVVHWHKGAKGTRQVANAARAKPPYVSLFETLGEILDAKERRFRHGMGLTMLLLVLLLSLL